MESGLPSFRRPSTGAAVLAHQNTGATTLRVRVSHPLRTRFPVAFLSRVAVPAAPLWESPPGRTTPNARRPQPHACVKFGLVRVRSPLLAESLSFPRGTKMFQFPRFPLLAYRFNEECRPITADGLPHSGTLGSLPALRLPKAFRSAPRPSSACNAKASTSDACSLTAQSPCSFFHTTLNPAARPPRPTGGAGPRKAPDLHQAKAQEDAGPCGLGAVRFLYCSYLSCQRASGSPWTRTRGLCLIRAAL